MTREYSVQRLSQCAEEERFARVDESRKITIGNSFGCDLRLHVSFGLPDVCVKIRLEGRMCIVEDVTGDMGLVLVNGSAVYGFTQLDDGDSVQVGSDHFLVACVNQDASPESEPPQPANQMIESSAVVSRTLDSVHINAFVCRHSPVEPEWAEAEILEHLCEEHGAFLFANFRHAGVRVPDPVAVGDDLFGAMPDEVREIYSLHAVADLQPSRSWKFMAAWKNGMQESGSFRNRTSAHA